MQSCYTFENACNEEEMLFRKDGCHSIFLSTCGENEEEVSGSLVTFLKSVKADLEESMNDFEDDFVRKLQNSVKEIKKSREMEGRFMMLQLLLRDERLEGKAEGKAEDILALLEELGEVPESLRRRIMEETDLSVLKALLKYAARAESIRQFESKLETLWNRTS